MVVTIRRSLSSIVNQIQGKARNRVNVPCKNDSQFPIDCLFIWIRYWIAVRMREKKLIWKNEYVLYLLL